MRCRGERDAPIFSQSSDRNDTQSSIVLEPCRVAIGTPTETTRLTLRRRTRLRGLSREVAAGEDQDYSAVMIGVRPVIVLLATLTALEAVLFLLQSPAPLSTIREGALIGFLFGAPMVLIGGLVTARKPWIVMAAVMYSTIALALDLATIVQEASQSAPRAIVLTLTVGSSFLNFLIMIVGGRCAFTVQPGEQPRRGPHPNLQFPSSH